MSETLDEQQLYVTPAEYLAAEAVSEAKHEYLAGMVYAMAGGTRAHGQISSNIISALHAALRGRTCRSYGSDVRVRITRGSTTFYYYPDAMVDCSGSTTDEVDEPTIVFEVLSPSTARVDRIEKLGNYQSIPSLRAYVMVDQARPSVTVTRRGASGEWTIETMQAIEGFIDLPEIACSLPLRAIYDRAFSN